MTLKYQAKPRTIAWKLGSASFCFANNIIGLKAVNSLRYIPDVMKTGSANVNFFVWSEMLLKTNENQQGFLYFITGTASLLFLCSSLNLWPLMSQTVHSFFENSTALVSASFFFFSTGVVREGLTHPSIPDGWRWNGVVSDHCPVWAEFYCDRDLDETTGPTSVDNIFIDGKERTS